MKNFVFISPNFPMTYWKFCRELKNNGMRVLGIGDSPYDDLLQELRDSLDEYYKVSSLENYDEVFKAVAFFTYKYGKIDWLESNNEYWLMRDAALRTEFNITTGPKLDEMDKIKFKSCMKEYYAKAGIPTARYHLVEGLEDALEFAHTVAIRTTPYTSWRSLSTAMSRPSTASWTPRGRCCSSPAISRPCPSWTS